MYILINIVMNIVIYILIKNINLTIKIKKTLK